MYDAGAQGHTVEELAGIRAPRERSDHHARLLVLGEAVASLTDQIRTPPTSASLYGSNPEGASRPLAEEPRFDDDVLARLQHLERLVRHLLIFARGGASHREPIALSGLVRAFCLGMEVPLREAGGSLLVNDHAPGVKVFGDREALLTALQNLATNAIQAAGWGCRLELDLRAMEADTVDLVLVDSGPGIVAELRERIFEPFFSAGRDGAGLGLPVVRSIAHAHEGSVWVDSQPGEGARFTLRLPQPVEAVRGDALAEAVPRQVA